VQSDATIALGLLVRPDRHTESVERRCRWIRRILKPPPVDRRPQRARAAVCSPLWAPFSTTCSLARLAPACQQPGERDDDRDAATRRTRHGLDHCSRPRKSPLIDAPANTASRCFSQR
jgi:hypothetical protein